MLPNKNLKASILYWCCRVGLSELSFAFELFEGNFASEKISRFILLLLE